jgi:hypothetical protein
MPIRFVAALLFAVLLTGCLDYEERIVIGRDGSAKIELQLRISRTIQGLVRQNPAFSALAMMMDPDTLRKNLPEGVALESHRTIPGSGRIIYANDLVAPDVQKLAAGDASLFQGQKFEVETLPDGSLRYRRTLDFSAAAKDPELSQMIAQNKMGIVGILKGSKFAFSLESPLAIQSTNGRVEGNKISWNYVLFDLLYNPVEQEVVLAAPTAADKFIGAVRLAFRPQYFPFLAVLCVALFFAATYRKQQ